MSRMYRIGELISRARSLPMAYVLMMLIAVGCKHEGDVAGKTPPTITTQPAAVTVTAGETATFSVAASGTAPFTYQWRKNGTDIPGATSSIYALTTTVADSGAKFSVRVANSAGMATSADATLTVNSPIDAPSITTQPVSKTVAAGETATFSVVAAGTAPLTYQWRKNNVDIAGANAATYTTPATMLSDTGAVFTVRVTNTAGSVVSANATLTVMAAAVAPSITTQPASVTVTAGANATFNVVATGTTPLSYQWRRNNVDIGGANASTYTTPATSLTDSGSVFSVRVANAAGFVISNNATLTVMAAAQAPTITTQPTSQTVNAGASATFSVVATGSAPLSYQWQKNNADIAGATGATYTTPATASTDSGASYRVRVSNTAGSVTSNAALLTVNVPSVSPTITTQPSSQSVFVGSTATFTVVASGTSPLSYQWQKNGADISGATSASYTTPATVLGDNNAVFRVRVSNMAGSTTSVGAALTVTQRPVTSDAPSMGVNLDFLTDYSASQMMADLVKTGRPFSKLNNQQGGGGDNSKLSVTDSNGWPTEDFSFYLFADVASSIQMGGTYKGRFNGQSSVSANGASIANKAYDSASNMTTFDLVVPSNTRTVVLHFSGTGGSVKNLKVMRPGHDFNATWNTQFLALIQPFGIIRTMNATDTNGNPEARWSDRRLPSDSQWASSLSKNAGNPNAGSGLPWELIVDLANTTDKDIWINVPHKADDDYIRQLATLIHATLEPGRKVYLEYSNEVWNGQFSQSQWNIDRAVAEAPSDPDLSWDGESNRYYLGQRRVAKRVIQIGNIFKGIMGDAAFGTRYRPVYATQIGNSGFLPDVLDTVNRRFGPPTNVLYAAAGAPYVFGDRNESTADAIIANLQGVDVPVYYEYAKFAQATTKYNLPFIAYEGGPDMEGASRTAIAAANADARMEGVTYDLLKGWFDSGFKSFVWFAITSANWSDSWGITDSPTKTDTPKFRAINRIIAEHGGM